MNEIRLEFAAFGPSQGIIYCNDLSDAQRRYRKLQAAGRTPAIYKADNRERDGKIKWRFLRQEEE